MGLSLFFVLNEPSEIRPILLIGHCHLPNARANYKLMTFEMQVCNNTFFRRVKKLHF